MALIFLRHTTPDVAPGTCYGRTDLDVAETFADEAEKVLASLPLVSRIISSPLQRCTKLANYIGHERRLCVDLDDRLVEMDFGAWEGIPWSDLPRHELDMWASDFLNARPHGGESVRMLRERVNALLADLSPVVEHTLLVCHSGVIKAGLARGDTAADFGTNTGFGAFVRMAEV